MRRAASAASYLVGNLVNIAGRTWAVTSDGQGRGMYWQGRFSVQGAMQICHAFKTPTTLLHFLLRVNSQQTAADQYPCSIGLSIGDTDTGPIPLVSAQSIPITSTGIGLSLELIS